MTIITTQAEQNYNSKNQIIKSNTLENQTAYFIM